MNSIRLSVLFFAAVMIGAVSIAAAAPDGARMQRLVAPDAERGDRFGDALVVTDDMIIVGAPYAAPEGGGYYNDQGAVYVFERHGMEWEMTQKLVASDGDRDDRFGSSLDLDGDRLVIGAPRAWVRDNPRVGVVYVFERQDGAWVESQRIEPVSYPAYNGQFGADVAIDGNRLIVGAPWWYQWTVGSSGAIFIYEYREDIGRWPRSAHYIYPQDYYGYPGHFGQSVDISGDTAVIGMRHNTELTGKAFVYEHNGWSWYKSAELIHSLCDCNGGFARDVIIADDKLLISAPNDVDPDDPEHTWGYLFEFERDGADWKVSDTIAYGASSSNYSSDHVAYHDGKIALMTRFPGDSIQYFRDHQRHGWQESGSINSEDLHHWDPNQLAMSRLFTAYGNAWADDRRGEVLVFQSAGKGMKAQ